MNNLDYKYYGLKRLHRQGIDIPIITIAYHHRIHVSLLDITVPWTVGYGVRCSFDHHMDDTENLIYSYYSMIEKIDLAISRNFYLMATFSMRKRAKDDKQLMCTTP